MHLDGRQQPAHRVSWQLHVGSIPEGLMVLHKCDVRPCVNPDHLYLGNHAQNMADVRERKRGNHAGNRGWTPDAAPLHGPTRFVRDDDETSLSAGAAAEMAGITVGSLRVLVKRGTFPPPDGHWHEYPWWTPQTIASWLETRKAPGRPRKS